MGKASRKRIVALTKIVFLFFFIFIIYQKTIGKKRRISDIIINVLKKEGDEIERTTGNECNSRNS